ncbi:hypothetical protein FACS189485_15410 [Spirochaetia bacterium]|nr:hypothetical protein FACS189485_15410 [Spirochaetia bacterium]
MRNISALFTKQDDGFIKKITPDNEQTAKIIEAKNKIRDYLRVEIAKAIKIKANIIVAPRFLSQGSAVYKTRNKPCSVPPQQMDHDLGCYLPLTIVKETGRPITAAQTFFDIVDSSLEQLVRNEHWVRIDMRKKTCSRVIIDNEIHIDVPLYSIPDTEFETIRENMDSTALFSNSIRKSIDNWTALDSSKVLLAHRTQGWKESDPRELNDYFRKTFQEKGDQLRRISRYLKAWRDFNWSDGGPSSIYLMIMADEILSAEVPERDDLALLNTLSGIYERLIDDSFQVRNPTDSKEIIEISDTDRDKLKKISAQFKNDLDAAIKNSSISDEDACKLIRKHLGGRFPCVPKIPETNQANKNEQFIELLFPVDIRYNLSIDCVVKQDGWRDFFLSDSLREGKKLKHHKELNFFIKYTNAPEPFSIYWKVRNVGAVAERRNCIRGQIVKTDFRKHNEHTDFYGPHFVECYIVKNDICVARNRIDVPIDDN